MAYAEIHFVRHIGHDFGIPKRIGQIALAWNGLHANIFAMFYGLSGLSQAEAGAIFYSVKADSAQRDMTQALVKQKLSLKKTQRAKELLDDLNRFFVDVRNYSGNRNGIIHASLLVNSNGHMLIDSFNPPSDTAPRANIFARLSAERDTVQALADLSAALFNRLSALQRWPVELLELETVQALPTPENEDTLLLAIAHVFRPQSSDG